jgi:hypothetical protein
MFGDPGLNSTHTIWRRPKRQLRSILLLSVVFVASLSVGACVYIQHPKFGKLPEGDRLEIIKKSPNYADGEFRNLIATPMFADDSIFLSVLVSNLLVREERLKPGVPLPSVKTDLKTLGRDRDTVV